MTPWLAMHMANELLSVPLAVLTLALAGGAVALAALRAGRGLDAERLPLTGVMGAFVFAAQMINFTLPGMPGTSGHLGGGVLLAIVLGPWAGVLTMAAILIVQCLLFQDGGLLALGCNIINMGVAPCLGGWAVYRLATSGRRALGPKRQYLAAWLACLVGVTGGAALVPIEAGLAGVVRIPLVHFLAVMVGVHLLLAVIEGLITFAVIGYLRRVRPAALGLGEPDASGKLGRRFVVASFAATALLLAGVVSWFASTSPDGLESSVAQLQSQAGAAEPEPSGEVALVNRFHSQWAPLPGYGRREAPLGQENPEQPQRAGQSWPGINGWGSLAGVAGTFVTLGLLYLLAGALRRRRVPERPT